MESSSNDSGSEVNITVSGEAADSNYDTATFGTIAVDATELDITFQDIDTSASYVIEQTNPALAYFSEDSSVSGTTKTKTYAGADMSGNAYQIVLIEGGTPVTVKLYKVVDGANELVQTINITNNITFAA